MFQYVVIFGFGPIAQLGERLLRKQEVGGSTPPRSTNSFLETPSLNSKSSMHRFYLPNEDLTTVKLARLNDPQELHHAKTVLRLKPGQSIKIFNGQGSEAVAEIIDLRSSSLEFRIKTVISSRPITPLITLACAIPKKAKFEDIIEKGTELSVQEIIPLITERTLFAKSGKELVKKTDRYQTVAINAAKQSGCLHIPTIKPITVFKEVLNEFSRFDHVFIPTLEGKRKNFSQACVPISPQSKIIILIGPEGDFTPSESQWAQEKGAIPLSLGQTVLKVDTAALSIVAAIRLWQTAP